MWRLPRRLILILSAYLLLLTGVATAQGTDPGDSGVVTAAGCSELLVNGGFEVTDRGWDLFGAEARPAYTTSPVFAGRQSLRLGIVEGANVALINGARQTVFLPDSASDIVLGFHYRPVHESNPGDDLQYLDLYNADTGQKISRIWSQLADGSSWIFLQYDLTNLRGQNIRIEFGVRNDGGGGRTSLILDDVSLLACDVAVGITSTPTPTSSPFVTTGTATVTPSPFPPGFPSATATPTYFPPVTTTATPTRLPIGCQRSSVIANGGFETGAGHPAFWVVGQDPVPPELSGVSIEGNRSMQLGNPPVSGSTNVVTYSSVRQLITLPANSSSAFISWRFQPHSQEGLELTPHRWQDRQELILLEPSLATKRILWRQRLNSGNWLLERLDLTPFAGQSFYVYFNVFNDGDGGRTWMYLDDIYIEFCTSQGNDDSVYSPLPSPTATSTPIPLAAAQVGIRSSDASSAEGPLVAVGRETPDASTLIPDQRTLEPLAVETSTSFWQSFLAGLRRSRGLIAVGFVLGIILLAVYFLRS